ncbi:MAG: hypothetical protein ACI9L9_002146 [Marivirga sp.]|jgi:hypothetical protein
MVVQAWMRGILLLGGFYNAIWAIFLFYKGDSYIKWISEGTQDYNQWVFYQAIGIVAVGVLMLWSIVDPIKYKWLLFIVFFSKLFGGGIVYLLIMESLFNKKFMFHLLMNDIVWLVPLAIILSTVFSKKR